MASTDTPDHKGIAERLREAARNEMAGDLRRLWDEAADAIDAKDAELAEARALLETTRAQMDAGIAALADNVALRAQVQSLTAERDEARKAFTLRGRDIITIQEDFRAQLASAEAVLPEIANGDDFGSPSMPNRAREYFAKQGGGS